MNETMQKFLKLISENEELRAKATDADRHELAAMAKELGLDLKADEFKKPEVELSDDELEAVSGGLSDTVDLCEERMPLGWYVTCANCTLGFPVSEGSCPSCGGTEVWHGTDRATVVYDPNWWKNYYRQ